MTIGDTAARTTVPNQDGLYSTIPEQVYHADRRSLSMSGANLILPPGRPPKPCPAKFREAMLHRPKPKPEYDFGHLVHELRLGKGQGIAVVDAPNYNTKAAQKARDEAHAAGKTPALPKQIVAALRMVLACNRHVIAGPLFAKGHAETSFYQTDPDTGVRLRGRTDWITLFDFGQGEQLVIVDYKTSTTADPDELERKFWTYGYFRQAAWYIDLVAAVMHTDPVFVFVVQEKEPPYLPAVIEYTPDAIAEGRAQNRQAVDLYAECAAADAWPAWPGNDHVQPISIPPWAFPRQPTVGDLIDNYIYDTDPLDDQEISL